MPPTRAPSRVRIARGYDEFTDPPASGGKAELSARLAALCASGSANCPATPSSANPVWPSQAGASSTVDVLWDCPPTFAGRCVQVNVYRDGTSAGTRASGLHGPASWHHVAGRASDCLGPRRSREFRGVPAPVGNPRQMDRDRDVESIRQMAKGRHRAPPSRCVHATECQWSRDRL